MKKAWKLAVIGIALGISATGCYSCDSEESRRYRFQGENFSIVFPEGWKIEREGNHVSAVGKSRTDSQLGPSVFVQIIPYRKGGSAADFGKRILDEMMDYQIFEVDDEGRKTISGETAYWALTYLELDGFSFQRLEYYYTSGKRAYRVVCSSNSQEFEGLRSKFARVCESVRFD